MIDPAGESEVSNTSTLEVFFSSLEISSSWKLGLVDFSTTSGERCTTKSAPSVPEVNIVVELRLRKLRPADITSVHLTDSPRARGGIDFVEGQTSRRETSHVEMQYFGACQYPNAPFSQSDKVTLPLRHHVLGGKP